MAKPEFTTDIFVRPVQNGAIVGIRSKNAGDRPSDEYVCRDADELAELMRDLFTGSIDIKSSPRGSGSKT